MTQTILLIIAAIILSLNLILTIVESIRYYHAYYPSAAHPGRIRGALVRGGGEEKEKVVGWVEIDGMRYNVEWYYIGRKEVKDSGK